MGGDSTADRRRARAKTSAAGETKFDLMSDPARKGKDRYLHSCTTCVVGKSQQGEHASLIDLHQPRACTHFLRSRKSTKEEEVTAAPADGSRWWMRLRVDYPGRWEGGGHTFFSDIHEQSKLSKQQQRQVYKTRRNTRPIRVAEGPNNHTHGEPGLKPFPPRYCGSQACLFSRQNTFRSDAAGGIYITFQPSSSMLPARHLTRADGPLGLMEANRDTPHDLQRTRKRQTKSTAVTAGI